MSPRLKEFVSDGLIEMGPKGLKILESGKPFLRNICMAYDLRLIRKQPDKELFSKTI